jgi:hypothetical protein
VTSATSTAVQDQPRRLGRSTAAIAIGFFSVAVLSLATDQVLHVLNVYPPWGEPMWDPRLNLLALSYRIVYTIFGGYLTAPCSLRCGTWRSSGSWGSARHGRRGCHPDG